MKFAKRMILIPETDFQQSSKKPQSMRKAAIEITQKLGKQIRHRNQSAARLKAQWNPLESQIGPTVQLSSLYKESKPMTNVLDVSEMMPTLYRNKSKLLLSQLQARGMKWNTTGELILPDGRTIDNSNILDLLKEAFVGSRSTTRSTRKQASWSELASPTSTRRSAKKPVGWTEFIEGMAQVAIPYGIFKKQSTLDDLNDARVEWEEMR